MNLVSTQLIQNLAGTNLYYPHPLQNPASRLKEDWKEVKQSEEALRSVVSLLEKWVHAVVQECQTMMQLQEPFCLRVEALVACSDAALHL